MSQTLSLTALPRLTVVSLLDELTKKGGFSLRDLKGYQKLMDRIDLNEDERIALNIRTVVTIQSKETKVTKQVSLEEYQKLNSEEYEVLGGAQVRWDSKEGGKDDGKLIDVEVPIEFSKDMVETLTTVLKKWNDEKLFTIEVFKAIEPIIEALEIEEELGLDKPE